MHLKNVKGVQKMFLMHQKLHKMYSEVDIKTYL